MKCAGDCAKQKKYCDFNLISDNLWRLENRDFETEHYLLIGMKRLFNSYDSIDVASLSKLYLRKNVLQLVISQNVLCWINIYNKVKVDFEVLHNLSSR